MERERQLREELVRICRKMEAKGLVAATDGNVSCRLEEDRILITPSGTSKGDLRPEDLLLVDAVGRVVKGSGRPSSEIRMHLAVYDVRVDVGAVVHAHPPLLTALTLAGLPFQAEVLPEVWLTIGPVPTAPYATPSTDEVPASLAPFIAAHQAFLLERHGSLTLGASLEEAYRRLEKLEHAAQTLLYAQMLAGHPPEPLSRDALDKLSRIKGAVSSSPAGC